MKESAFIKQNQKKWKQFEEDLSNKTDDPGKISKLFVQITDDLSFARTFYKNRSVRVYLNGVAQVLFNDIYKKKKIRKGEFLHFWKTDLPLQFYHARRAFLISTITFLLFALMGAYSCSQDETFARSILGDQYVNMTLENIEKGDPMAIYKQDNVFGMFFRITTNNILVALRTFIFGVFASIGTMAILLYNGVMVGTFQYFFVESGNFKESFLTIWQHGTIEISSIVIAGGAGLYLGKGLIFPGTLKRSHSFRLSAQRGVKIMLGLIPLFIIAGFIETFITRYTEVPDIIRILVILFSFAFIIGYFCIYPRYVYKHATKEDLDEKIVSPALIREIDIKKIHTAPEIIGNAIQFVSEKSSLLIKTSMLLALLFSFCGLVIYDLPNYHSTTEVAAGTNGILDYINFPWLAVCNTFIFGFCLLIFTKNLLQFLSLETKSATLLQFVSKHLWKSIIASAVINALFFLQDGWGILSIIISMVGISIATNLLIKDEVNFPFSNGIQNLKAFVGQFVVITLALTGIIFLFYKFMDSMVFSSILSSLTMVYEFSTNTKILVSYFIFRFIISGLLLILVNTVIIIMAFFNFSANEKSNASFLNQKIDNFLASKSFND